MVTRTNGYCSQHEAEKEQEREARVAQRVHTWSPETPVKPTVALIGYSLAP